MGTTTVGTIGLNMVLNSAGFKQSLQNVQSQASTASQKMNASFKKVGLVADDDKAITNDNIVTTCIDVPSSDIDKWKDCDIE
ncbi:MAG: hypothetical protein J1E85_08110 [Ruminococcus sp.]|nr:hypothetical protein [Ruminococcus sp.]